MTYLELAPGVLSGPQLESLVNSEKIGSLSGFSAPREIDASAFDLRIGDCAWRLRDAQRPTTRELLELKARSEEVTMSSDASGSYFELERGQIYLLKLDDVLDLPPNISGRATGKSSIGRLDIITRLLTSSSREYDLVPPGYEGDLYLLVVPQTFSIRVAPGGSLNQLRLLCGPHSSAIIRRDLVEYYGSPFWYLQASDRFEEWSPRAKEPIIDDPALFDLTVELSDEHAPYVYKARIAELPPLDLRSDKKGGFDPSKYFEQVPVDRRGSEASVVLDKDCFYIMKSRERLSIPQDVAVEVVAISERIGDIRIHYAGFAHPGFGRARSDGRKGTPLIFEVRATDMQTRLSSSSLLARIQLFKMSEPVPLESRPESAYEEQELKLSSIFGDWPQNEND